MSNPFPTHFDSECKSCENKMFKGSLMFACGNNYFVCKKCAKERHYVCQCGQVKKANCHACYRCAKKVTYVV